MGEGEEWILKSFAGSNFCSSQFNYCINYHFLPVFLVEIFILFSSVMEFNVNLTNRIYDVN